MTRYRCTVQVLDDKGNATTFFSPVVYVAAYHPREAAWRAMAEAAPPSAVRALVRVWANGFNWGYDVTRELRPTYHAREF